MTLFLYRSELLQAHATYTLTRYTVWHVCMLDAIVEEAPVHVFNRQDREERLQERQCRAAKSLH